jgi:thimet oligopeptidase
MRSRHSIIAALALTTAIPAAAEPLAVDRFIGDILANPGDAATIAARCDAVISESERRRAELESETGPATLETTLQRYDDIYNLLYSGLGEFALLREVMLDDARRAAGGACEVRLTSEMSKLGLSRPIYERMKAIDAGAADPASRHYLARQLASFEREGVALDEAGRLEVQAIQDELAQLSTEFERAIAAGRKTVIAEPSELEGLPADYIAAHPPGANGKVTISTDYPDIIPAMTYARSDALRQRLYEANMTRAWPENDARLARILDLRHSLAQKLGRPDYAALVLEDKMLGAPARVEQLLADMAAAARPAGMRDYAKKLSVLRQFKPGATEIAPWQNAFLGQIVQKQDYAYDRQATRAYFTYDRSRDGILQLAEDLFGIDIRPWQTTTWHEDVEAYELYDKGALVGRFYFDSHPRPGKYNHANMVPLRAGIRGRSIPVAALVMNLPKGDHATGLMEHGDVVTFLHEFGHLLHGLLSASDRWAGISGISTEWDFAEAPSQMLEEWVYDYDTLARFAVNAQGQTIPRDLVATMNRARYFDRGIGDMRQLALANISLGLHRGTAPEDLGAATRRLDNAYNIVPMADGAQMQASFGHLTGYSAIYYTYAWSKVIALDMFSAFRARGLRDLATAESYRRLVLEPGGSKPAARLVEDFLGRPITLDAYREELARGQ